MNNLIFYAALALAFACGIAITALIVSAYLKPALLSRGYAKGHSAAQTALLRRISDQQSRITALNHDLGDKQRQNEVERQRHRESVEAVMQDCDARVAEYSRRANPFAEVHVQQLTAASDKLLLAASTFAGIQAGDHAILARTSAGHLQSMAAQLSNALTAAKQPLQEEHAA